MKLKKIIIQEYQARRSINKGKPICLAPFKSLRFSPNGAITVCCHNNSFVLGHYPEISIKEAWTCSKINALKEAISNADFSLGCAVCFDSFDNRLFGSVNPLLYEEYNEEEMPVMFDFKIATECNMECVMCSEYSSSKIRANKSLSNVRVFDEDFLVQLREFIPTIKEARFSGGEPFMNKLYYQIWEEIIVLNPNCLISIQTNGSILNDQVLRLLKRGNCRINVSIDAVNSELYSQIRRGGEIQEVLNNTIVFAEYAEKSGNQLGITVCTMRTNWREFPELLKFANKINSKIWFSDVYFPLIYGLWNFDSKSLTEIILFLDGFKPQLNDSNSEHNYEVYNDMVQRIRLFRNTAMRRENNNEGLVSKQDLWDSLNNRINDKNSCKNLKKKLSNAFAKLPDERIINIVEMINDFHSIDFIVELFTNMSEEELIDNFRSIQIDYVKH